MEIFKLRRITVRTMHGDDGETVVARVRIEHPTQPTMTQEELSHYDALTLGSALLGFGMAGKPDQHIAGMMGELLAIIEKYGGTRPVLNDGLTLVRPTDGH